MPGAGTKPVITRNNQPPARLLDLTRLVARASRGPLTGIDRVERAYLEQLLKSEIPLFLLVRTVFGFILLDAAAAAGIAAKLVSPSPPSHKQTLTELRKSALARCSRIGLMRMLMRNLPKGTAYLNVGHENLTNRLFAAVKATGGTAIVLIHDTIALDYPQFQGKNAPQKFEAKLRSVGVAADLVIYNSAQSQQTAERYFTKWGRVPTSVVAHLGIDPVAPDAARLPKGYDFSRPYFVTVSTIEPRKNHALLLDIWAKFNITCPPGDIPQLFIIGRRGWNNDVLFARLDSEAFMGVNVHEISGLDDPGLAALIKGSAGVLFPSLVEGFGLPVAEAAAMNVPVVCRDLAIYREILGDYPIYVTPENCYSWAKVIGTLAFFENSEDVFRQQQCLPPSVPAWEAHFNVVLNMT